MNVLVTIRKVVGGGFMVVVDRPWKKSHQTSVGVPWGGYNSSLCGRDRLVVEGESPDSRSGCPGEEVAGRKIIRVDEYKKGGRVPCHLRKTSSMMKTFWNHRRK